MSPLSLLDCFLPPEGMCGVFATVCGFSADAGFLEEALQRFTGCSAAARAHDGRVAMSVMLEPRQPALSTLDVPGMVHLPYRPTSQTRFRLMHAKVALLAYRHPDRAGDWCLRVLVSTGNWTTQTVEESLDLAWRVQVRSGDLVAAANDQAITDLAAAIDFMNWLQTCYDGSLLAGARREVAWLRECADAVATRAEALAQFGVRPRFIDSRRASILDQLLPAIHAQGKRNYLAMGSGFFESHSQGVPRVLQEVVQRLLQGGLLAPRAHISVFVNELACQSIAQSGVLTAMQKAGWSVRAAAPPPALFGRDSKRSLHAKFLFSAQRGADRACKRPWVYLGSGNLTSPGLTQRAGPQGNLEAGVVFEPPTLAWSRTDRGGDAVTVCERLPIHDERELLQAIELAAGERLPLADTPFLAAPVNVLHWEPTQDGALGGLLRAIRDEETGSGWQGQAPALFDPLGEALAFAGAAEGAVASWAWCWQGACPRQVRMRWRSAHGADQVVWHERDIPVLDDLGRLAATPLQPLAFEDLQVLIQAAPTSWPDDPPDGGDESETSRKAAQSLTPSESKAGGAIRLMTAQIEAIATRQCALDRAAWPAWCARLGQLLTQVADSAVVQQVRQLELNPISALRAPPFRPAFTHAADAVEAQIYEETLDRVEKAWGMSTYPSLEID